MSPLSRFDSCPPFIPSDFSSLGLSLDWEDSILPICSWIFSGMSPLSRFDSCPPFIPPIMMVIFEPESPSLVIEVPESGSVVFEGDSNLASLSSLSSSTFLWLARVLTPAASISSAHAFSSSATLTDQAPVSIDPNVVWINSLSSMSRDSTVITSFTRFNNSYLS